MKIWVKKINNINHTYICKYGKRDGGGGGIDIDERWPRRRNNRYGLFLREQDAAYY